MEAAGKTSLHELPGRPGRRRSWRLAWLAALLPFCTLAVRAIDDDPGNQGPPDVCLEPGFEIVAAPYLNGLPLLQEELVIVGDRVKVAVETTPRCRMVTPPSLPFEWKLMGPSGPVPLLNDTTLQPHFRPTVAGAYEARLTYCPNECDNVHAGANIVDIPALSSTFHFDVVTEIPLPPSTQPVLTPGARATPAPELRAVETEFHQQRDRKCAFAGGPLAELETPQLVPVRPWPGTNYALLAGTVRKARIAGVDNELNHTSHDVGIHVTPDPQHELLMIEGKAEMEIEWESGFFPRERRPVPGDRISAWGFHTYDCHHPPVLTEIHPPVFTAVHRPRPIRIPDGWPSPSAGSLGSGIYVPGIVTDISANVRAGEMTSNCSEPGLHQEATVSPTGSIQYGACILSPHPIQREFKFNVYLPENPQKRMAAAGRSAPPVPLYVSVDDARVSFEIAADDGLLVPTPQTDDDVTYLKVTVNLVGYVGETFTGRILAGWVLPSSDNWGLESWKVGISSMRVYEDHDLGTDGDWVFWAATNNYDRTWTRLIDGGSVGEGTHTFDDRPWETGSAQPDRSLGPHPLLFNPRFGRYFPGVPHQDLSQSLLLHTAGYDAEIQDDPVGEVNAIIHPQPWLMAVGARRDLERYSVNPMDYRLDHFVERLGPVPPALLSDAGRALVEAYTIRPAGANCTRIGRTVCVLFPEVVDLVAEWHPILVRRRAGDKDLDWSEHPIYEAQKPEQFNLTQMPVEELGRAAERTRAGHPQRLERIFGELRQEFDEVRGTFLESEYARALPLFEPHLPADLWQRHFGDIDPTPVELTVTRISMSPPGAGHGQNVVFAAEIANRGTGTAAPFAARIEIDGTALRVLQVSGLAPGATTVVEFPAWTAAAGEHQLRASADALSQIAEPAEDDNTLERRFIVGQEPVGLADLLVVGVRFEPIRRVPGQAITFIARVQNTGGNVFDDVVVRFVVDRALVGHATIAGLPSGQTVEVRSPAWTAVRRGHTVAVTVDAAHAVPEKDEANNAFTRRFAVRARAR